MAVITPEMTINDVVKKHPETMKVFNDHEVDSCCGGAESIETTAAINNADMDTLMVALNKAVADKE